MALPEPWLRGPMPGINPFIAPLLFSFAQANEDLAHHTAGLTDAQVWARPHGFAPVGFHLRHIAASIDRLATYLEGGQLDDRQMAELRSEMEPGEPLASLLDRVRQATGTAVALARSLSQESLTQPRGVGRKQLPTTVIGLVVHIAEHTQRHVGQAIAAAKLARATTTAAAD
jgi:uncharacterized damage-inducible protein DinB